MSKNPKQFVREAPNDQWFWKNRNKVRSLIPDIEIEEPNQIIKKDDASKSEGK